MEKRTAFLITMSSFCSWFPFLSPHSYFKDEMAFSNLWGWACSPATCSVPFSICLHWSLAHLGLSSGLTGTALEVALFPSCLRKFRFNSEALESLCQADFIVGLRMVTGLFWRPLSLQFSFSAVIFSREASPWVASCEKRRFRGPDFQWYHFQPWPSPPSLWLVFL